MNRTENPHIPSTLPFYSLYRFSRKKSPACSNLNHLSKSFDQNLNLRLKSLFSGEKSPEISLSWLSRSVDLLSKTHSDAKCLISEVKIPNSGNWPEFYLDHSVKLLDLCNSISAEISRLQHSRLLIHYVLHLLDFSGDSSPAPENLRRARDSLKGWYKDSPEFGRRLENPAVVLRDLTHSLRKPPPIESSAAGKLLFRKIYAVNAVTILVTSTLVAALYGLPGTAGIRVSGDFAWADAFNDIQLGFHGEIKRRLSGGLRYAIEESDGVESCVARVAAVLDDVSCQNFAGKEKEQTLENAVKELENASEKFSGGLDSLLNGIHGFFEAVLCTRNALLQNFRAPKK